MDSLPRNIVETGCGDLEGRDRCAHRRETAPVEQGSLQSDTFRSSVGIVLLLFDFWTLNQVGATKPHMLKVSGGSQGPRGDGEFQGDPWSGSGRRT